MALSLRDVAKKYGVCIETVTHWVKTGQLRALNVGREPGKLKPRYKVTEKQLADFEESREIQTRQPRNRRPRVKAHGDRHIHFPETG